MRYLLIMFLVMCFVVGCGCSNVLTPPVLAQDTKDVWPIFYGTDNGGPDNGLIVFWDQLAGAWQAPRTVDTDLLDAQWTPQRNAVGWRGGTPALPGGKWNVSFIEATGNDLELWESPDDGWQDDAGAWAMLDGDASRNNEAVDVETRQNYVWQTTLAVNVPYFSYIDLSAGVPAITFLTGMIFALDPTTQYSIVLDNTSHGLIQFVAQDNTDSDIKYWGQPPYGYSGNFDWLGLALGGTYNYPQIVVDGNNEMFVFGTEGNILAMSVYSYMADIWYADTEAVYTATVLADDYHATWLKMDDTIHVVLVDWNAGVENSTYLIYLRRTPNGWTAPVTLLTVNSAPIEFELLTYPQICVDKMGNIFVSYIYTEFEAPVDLQGFYLDVTDYADYTVIGAGGWIRHLNIDQSATTVVWAIMPDSVPITMGM